MEPESIAKQVALRDYFAAEAMQAQMSSPEFGGHYAEFAERAYEVAEAMMAERARRYGLK